MTIFTINLILKQDKLIMQYTYDESEVSSCSSFVLLLPFHFSLSVIFLFIY